MSHTMPPVNGNAQAIRQTVLVAMNKMTHSLTPAVDDGTLNEKTAFCGISAEDIERLSVQHGEALVLVRLRTARADGRTIMPIADLARWTRADDVLVADGKRWRNKDIWDVFPISLTTGVRHETV